MSETPSNMLPLGTIAPSFTLLDVNSGDLLALSTFNNSKGIVIMFICNHCPYVKHIQGKIVEIARKFQPQGVEFIAINSNDATAYPSDSPEKMRIESMENDYFFPYLYDETQEVAHAYQAACTPDFYVFDRFKKCVYRGRFDESTPGNNKPVTGNDLSQALQSLLEDEPISDSQNPSVGCNIKWKK